MDTFLDRLKAEHAELGEKIKKLDTFLFTPHSVDAGDVQRNLLLAQLAVMQSYQNILGLRISHLTRVNRAAYGTK